MGEFVEAWKESPRRKDCSAEMLERYESQIRQFVAWAGDGVDVRAVDDDMAERYAKHLAQEVAAILAAAEGEWRGLIEIGLHTGLRLGDACRLEWSAFKSDGSVEVTTGKTGAVVRLPSAGLLAALGMSGRALPSGYVLPEIAAIYARDPATVSKRVGQIFERAGIERKVKEKGWSKARADAGFHSLRHTFVTRAIEAGVPAAIVRALVGHATAAMTDRYTHISGEAVAAAFEKAGL